MTIRKTIGAAFLLLGLLAAPAARAGNDPSYYLGNDAALMAGAVTAITADASAAWYNPAGIIRADRDSIRIAANVLTFRLQSVPGALTFFNRDQRVVEDIGARDVTLVPSALAWSRKFGRRFAGSVGIFLTNNRELLLFGSRQEPVGAGKDSALQEGQYHFEDLRTVYHIGPSIAWAPNQRLKLGLSMFFLYSDITRSETLVYELSRSGGGQREVQFGSRRSWGNYTDYGFRFLLGAQWEIDPAWSVGATLRLPGVRLLQIAKVYDYATEGVTSGSELTDFRLNTGDPRNTGPSLIDPFRATIGASHRHGDWTFTADFSFAMPLEHFNSFYNQVGLWNLAAGARVNFAPDWAAGLGIFTDRSPYPVISQPGDQDIHYYGATVGIEFKSIPEIEKLIDGKNPFGGFETVLAIRYAYGSGESGGMAVDATEKVPRIRASVNGSTAHEFGIHLGGGFNF